ncbi:MAG TPA: cation diffusion facilitator family transporter [Devosiaceae bacterium]|nr:cation diffusion facilitator family transporter [Devosiaceae bacterium]
MPHDQSHHDHDHHHDHHHGPGHAHAPTNFGRAFLIGIGLNTAFIVAEVVAGLLGNSVALLADAGHNLSDVLGLVVAWVASVLVRRAPTARFTYGLRGSSILAALFNAVLLLVAVGAIALEAIQRLGQPAPVAGLTVMVIAALGILVNGATAMLFASGRKGDLNIRGAYLHMAADAAVSAGVVVAGLVIMLTGWSWLDPVASLAISAVIIWGTWSLLRDSLNMSLAAVPPGIDPLAVHRFVEGQAGVLGVHDIHIWPMSTTETALTAHLVMASHPGDAFLHQLCDGLNAQFGIGHSTIQIETNAAACSLAAEGAV